MKNSSALLGTNFAPKWPHAHISVFFVSLLESLALSTGVVSYSVCWGNWHSVYNFSKDWFLHFQKKKLLIVLQIVGIHLDVLLRSISLSFIVFQPKIIYILCLFQYFVTLHIFLSRLVPFTCISLLLFYFKLIRARGLPGFQMLFYDVFVLGLPSCILVHESSAMCQVTSRALLQ
jgi:hypothetical protein